MSKELRQRIIQSLEWLVADAKWRFDLDKNNLNDEGSDGGYSPELVEAIDVLAELKKDEPRKYIFQDATGGFTRLSPEGVNL